MRTLFRISLILVLFSDVSLAQTHIDQNGLKTSVINSLSAAGTQARRFEIAKVGYNSHHWQAGSIIIIELFNTWYSTGYEKYFIQIGYGEGTGTSSPKIYHVESQGKVHLAQITLGNSQDLSTSAGGYINKVIPIYADIRYYARYSAKITHLRNKVSNVTDHDQIEIIESPTPIDINDFAVSTFVESDIRSSGDLNITGNGVHYISNGNVLIGKTTQQNSTYRLDVEGSIRANEIKVNVDGADFVFEPDYRLKPIEEIENFIEENKHLPEIESAIVMKANGADLGTLNIKLLQKIEELTLYLIEQNKKIEDLQIQVNELKK